MAVYEIKVTHDDGNAIVEDFMEKEWKSSNLENFGRVLAREEFRSPLTLTAWGTGDEQELLGVARCTVMGNTVIVHQLLVKTEKRRKAGIGSALLKEVEQLCIENGWHKIRLSTSEKHANIGFYHKNGYEKETTLHNDAFGLTWFILAKYPLKKKK
ncbi:MAG: GNAT family N-acetyltransferase [Candidatus Odinarchaeota archaeon]